MFKQLLSLTEHSLEVSSKLSILDRLDDSLSAINLYGDSDISTESSSAFLRAIGISDGRSLDKDTIVRHLDRIQSEVAKDIFLRGRNINGSIIGILDQLKDSYTFLTKALLTSDKKEVNYQIDPFDSQTAQVNDVVLDIPMFLIEGQNFNKVFSLVTDNLYPGMHELVKTNFEIPDKGMGTYIVSTLKNRGKYLNNATLSYKKDLATGWRFYFDIRRTGSNKRNVWVVDYNDQVRLKKLLGQLIESLEVAATKISFSSLIDDYKVDKKKNKGSLELVYKFYIPMIITHIRVSYLITDTLKHYLDN